MGPQERPPCTSNAETGASCGAGSFIWGRSWQQLRLRSPAPPTVPEPESLSRSLLGDQGKPIAWSLPDSRTQTPITVGLTSWHELVSERLPLNAWREGPGTPAICPRKESFLKRIAGHEDKLAHEEELKRSKCQCLSARHASTSRDWALHHGDGDPFLKRQEKHTGDSADLRTKWRDRFTPSCFSIF